MADRIDPSVYALSIQLQVNSAAAMNTLQDFDNAIVNLEKSIADAATSAFSSIKDLCTQAEQAFTGLLSSVNIFSTTSSQIADNFVKIQTISDDLGIDTKSKSQSQIKDKKMFEEILSLNEDLLKYMGEMETSAKQFNKETLDIVEAVKQKNEGHDEQNKLLENDLGFLGKIFSMIGLVNHHTHRGVGHWGAIATGVSAVITAIGALTQDTEQFHTANYRTYASMQDLTDQTRTLTMEAGVLRTHSLAAYKALADVRTPNAELNKLAKTVGYSIRATGVQAEVWAEYTKQLRFAGLNTDQQIDRINKLNEAERKFGLTATDVNKIIQGTSLTTSQLATYFGRDAKQAFEDAKIGLGILNKELLIDDRAMESLRGQIADTSIETFNFFKELGGLSDVQTIEERYNSLTKASEAYFKSIGVTVEQLETMSAMEKQVYNDALKAAYGNAADLDVMAQMVKARRQLVGTDKERLLMLNGIRESLSKEKTTAEVLADINGSSNATTIAQLRILRDLWTSVFQKIYGMLDAFMTPVFVVFNEVLVQTGQYLGSNFKESTAMFAAAGKQVADTLRWLIDVTREFWGILRENETFNAFVSVLIKFKTPIIAVSAALLLIIPALMTVGYAISWVIGSIVGFASILLSPWSILIAAIVGVGYVIYTFWDDIVSVFTSIKNFVSNVFTTLTTYSEMFGGGITGMIGAVIATAITVLGDFLLWLGGWALRLIGMVIDAGARAVAGLAMAIGSGVVTMIETGINLGVSFINAVTSTISKLYSFVRDVIFGAINPREALRMVRANISSWVDSTVKWLRKIPLLGRWFGGASTAVEENAETTEAASKVIVDANTAVVDSGTDAAKATEALAKAQREVMGDLAKGTATTDTAMKTLTIPTDFTKGLESIESVPKTMASAAVGVKDSGFAAAVADVPKTMNVAATEAAVGRLTTAVAAVPKALESSTAEVVVSGWSKVADDLPKSIMTTVSSIESSTVPLSKAVNQLSEALDGSSVNVAATELSNVVKVASTSLVATETAFAGFSLVAAVDNVNSELQSLNDLESVIVKLSLPSTIDSLASAVVDSLSNLKLSLDTANFDAEFESLIVTINRYSDLIDNASARVMAIIESRTIPAMAAAAKTNIDEVIKAETITTVQVLHKVEGGEETADEQVELLKTQNKILEQLSQQLEVAVGNNHSSRIEDIHALLEEMIQAMNGGRNFNTSVQAW